MPSRNAFRHSSTKNHLAALRQALGRGKGPGVSLHPPISPQHPSKKGDALRIVLFMSRIDRSGKGVNFYLTGSSGHGYFARGTLIGAFRTFRLEKEKEFATDFFGISKFFLCATLINVGMSGSYSVGRPYGR